MPRLLVVTTAVAVAAVCITLAAGAGAGLEMKPLKQGGFKTTFGVFREGSGDYGVKDGDKVTVMATGLLKAGNKKFWSTADANEYPFTFEVGAGAVVAGLDAGVLGMREGELRKLEIPAAEAYGEKGDAEWKIPPHADLIFVIELQSIKKKGHGVTTH